jgi:hypothetical protein
MELTELSIVGTRWHATAIDDGVVGGRLTEFPAYLPRDEVVAGIKRQHPRILIRGTAEGIPQPRAATYWVDYLVLRAKLDRRERIGAG